MNVFAARQMLERNQCLSEFSDSNQSSQTQILVEQTRLRVKVKSASSHVILGHSSIKKKKKPALTHDFGLPQQRRSEPERILGRRDEWKHNPHFHHCAWPPPTAAAWIPPFMGAAQWDLHSFLLILPPIIPSSLHTLAARTLTHVRTRVHVLLLSLSASSNVDA